MTTPVAKVCIVPTYFNFGYWMTEKLQTSKILIIDVFVKY